MCGKRVARFLLAMCILLGTSAVLGESVARADNGLDVTSSYTYTIDPAADTVRVVAELAFRNVVPNREQGAYINKTYFAGFALPLPTEAINMVATQDGVPLVATPQPIAESANYFLLKIDFARNLFYEQSAQVLVTYDITGRAPRSENPSRLNDAYAAFDAYGIADAGKLTLRVVVPGGYTIDTFGDTAQRTEEDGMIVYTATDIGQPNDFNLFISARNDAALTRTEVTLADEAFVLRGWPGDTDWDTFVRAQIATGVPELAQLIGTPWPVEGALEVREAYTPYLYGYAGWFNKATSELEIGEELDPQVVVHELSHAWFNETWFFDRWVNEGLAQTYAALANEAAGIAQENPLPIDPAAPGHVQLAQWGDPLLTEGADEVEDFGYNASWFVIDSIVDEIGPEAMRRVFAATEQATLAYVGDAAPEATAPRTDWRRFVDLVDQLGGSQLADDLVRQYVLTPDQALELDARAAALTDYEALVSHGAGWAPPLAVRRAMGLWDFDTARQLVADAQQLLDQRDALSGEAKRLDLTLPPALETAYEQADRQLDGVGQQLDDQLRAARAVDAAISREAVTPGLVDQVGLIGTDVQPLLDDSRAAFARGDTQVAIDKAVAVVTTLDRRDEVGRSRLLRTGVALAGVLLVIVVLVRRRRRTKRRQHPPPAEPLQMFAQLRE